MTITNGYCTLTELKNRLDISSTDATRDAYMHQMIEAASRWIDNVTGRTFYALTATRYFTATDEYSVRVNGLLSVTTLKTDEDGDRTYETTWQTTDYDLMPYNDTPYLWVEVSPNSSYLFPLTRRGVQIAGSWGWTQTALTSSATLAEDLDATETGVDVSAGTAFEIGMTIRIDSEVMFVDAISTNTLTVRRGQNGSTAATHTTGAAITVFQAPAAVREACALYAARLYKRKDAVLGVAGVAQMGQIMTRVPEDKDIERLLEQYMRVTL